MKFDLQEHVKSGETWGTIRSPAQPITCRNGLRISIQASAFHYASPRHNDGPYDHFEVGYPSIELEDLEPYRDGDSPVYGYVPIEVIEDIIKKAGGVVEVKAWDLD